MLKIYIVVVLNLFGALLYAQHKSNIDEVTLLKFELSSLPLFEDFYTTAVDTISPILKLRDTLVLKDLIPWLDVYCKNTFSENECDSLKNKLLNTHSPHLFQIINAENSLNKQYNNITDLGEKTKLTDLLVNGFVRLTPPKFDAAQNSLNRLEQDILKQPTDSLLSVFHFLEYDYYLHKKEFEDAFDAMLNARKHSNRRNPNYYYIEYHIGIFYKWIKDYKAALKLYQQNKILALEDKKIDDYAYFSLGEMEAHFHFKDYTKTKSIATDILNLNDTITKGFFKSLAHIYKADCYLAEQNITAAEQEFNFALTESLSENNINEISTSYKGLAKVALAKNETDKAFKYLKKSKETNFEFDFELNQMLAQAYFSRQLHQEAFELSNYTANRYKEEDENFPINDFASGFVNERLVSLADEKKNAIARVRNESLIAGGIFLILILTFLFFIQQSNNKKLLSLNKSLDYRNNILKQYAYISSHDLKEPVRNVKIFTDLLHLHLNENNVKDETIDDYLKFIKLGSNTLTKMVADLKLFTEVNFDVSETETFHIKEIIEIVEHKLENTITANNAIIQNNISDSLQNIKFSKLHLSIVLQNLLQNSILFNNNELKQININALQKNAEVIVSIADNGIGIPDSFKQSIFEPFKSLHNKTENTLSGLGLSIVKTIVDNHNGKIWIEDNKPVGTIVNFSIPIEANRKYRRILNKPTKAAY